MGASTNDVLQALLLGLAIQILGSVVCVICACFWRSVRERVSRLPAGGEPMAEPDLELGTVTGGEGIGRPSGLAANRSAPDYEDPHHQDKLEHGADMDGLQNDSVVPGGRASTISCCVVNELETRASVPVVVDVSHAQQVEVPAGNINEAPVVQSFQDMEHLLSLAVHLPY